MIKSFTSKYIYALISVIFLVILILIYIFCGEKSKVMELIIQIYGSFIATLLGVYISLYYTSIEQKRKEDKELHKTMQSSLKLIWSELDVNSISLNNLLHGLEDMPRNLSKLYDQVSFIAEHVKGMKYQAFYGTITSGSMNEISLNDKIFNAIQQAYFNTEMTVNGLNLILLVYKEFADKTSEQIGPENSSNALKILEKEIVKAKSTIFLVNKAKKIIRNYLRKTGVTFSKDEPMGKEAVI